MFKETRKQTRPDTNVQFWTVQTDPAVTDEFRNYFYENYVLTGKFISTMSEISNDGLSMTMIAIWNSESDYTDSTNDPAIQAGLRNNANAWWTANNITAEVISRETF